MTREDYTLQSRLRYQRTFNTCSQSPQQREMEYCYIHPVPEEMLDLSIQHLFGSTYDDILEASDRLRRWHIDPSKNLKYDLHILSQLIETSQHDIAESQILAIINKEI